MSAQEYKKQVFEAVQDLLWKQWTALGVPGHIAASKSNTVLDSEALLVFSAGFARYDQRLYDLILDWLQVHSSQINIQRLKALHAKSEWKDSASLGYMSAVAAKTNPTRWKKPATDYLPEDAKSPVALFLDENGEPERYIPRQDEQALKYGFRRNVRVDALEMPVSLPKTTATLLLRMRGFLGISARAEGLLVLLTSPRCKVQDIVDRSGFSWKTIQDVLGELASGGFVSSVDGVSRGKLYYLPEPDSIQKLFGIRQGVLFPNWLCIYDAIGLLWQTVSNPHLGKVSEETFSHELGRLYEDRLQQKLLKSGHPALNKTKLDCNSFPRLISSLAE